MKLLNVTPLTDAGNVRAIVEVETPDGDTFTCRIVKQDGFRACLVPPEGITFSHKEKRKLQREAVTAWANQISGSLDGLLISEKVYKGSRMNRLHVQLKAFCTVCDRNTPSEFSETEKGLIRNACFFCGTLRKGKPYVSQEYVERHCEKIDRLNARQGSGDRYVEKSKVV
ncbi:MAG: hypothetical protein PWQ89_483 [Verrucomicrobiota bacterium]|jgi:hypothetical protein|nr:hypothetical protein [Verrucomicrobiota bacterium]